MTATAVFLFGVVHICRLATAALLLYLAWEVRRRPGSWLFCATTAGGLGLMLGEALQLVQLSQQPAGSPARPWLGTISAVLIAAALASLCAWALQESGWRLWVWAPWAAVACGWFAPWPDWVKILLALAPTGAVMVYWTARVQRHPVEARFFKRFGAVCSASTLSLLLPEPYASAVFAPACLSLPLLLLHGIERRNLFGLRSSRRLLFLGTLGLISALYLLAVQRSADQLSWEYGQSRALVEVVLILAAAVLWLPLYEWMSRRMARRAEMHARFSKKVVEQAAGLAEPDEQIQFLAKGLAATLGCSRLLLASRGIALRMGLAGLPAAPDESEIARVIEEAAASGEEMIHQTSAPPELRAWLEANRFDYLLPLRHENRTIGALLLDVSPRRYLSDLDPMFPAMCREVGLLLTASRLAEEKVGLERALMAQEGRATLGDLTATIAHEIKNPLSTIRALAQLMREDRGLGEQYERHLDYILQESERLDGSVRQLLEFARPPAQTPVNVDVSALLGIAARKLAVDAASAGLVFESRIAPGLKLHAADLRSVEQIASNILQNAVQASPPGGKVQLVAEREDGAVVIAVSDEGPGVPEAVKEKIFQPYFSTRQSGTGLGLAIVRRNLRQLKGTVSVESPVAGGRGTRMIVSLPVEDKR